MGAKPDPTEQLRQAVAGKRPTPARELWDFLRANKKWWLLPILLALLLVAVLVLASGSALAPFIYPLF